jgi:hypothetical protein
MMFRRPLSVLRAIARGCSITMMDEHRYQNQQPNVQATRVFMMASCKAGDHKGYMTISEPAALLDATRDRNVD